LNAGTINPDGTVTLTPTELTGLTITPPADFSGSFDLSIGATSTDGTDTATVSDTFGVTVTPVADAPTLTAADVTGAEDTAIALDIDTAVTDGSEVLSVTIGNIPDGAVLNAGTVNPDGTVTLTPTELTGLTITPPTDFSGSFDLSIASTSTDGTDTATVSDTFGITVTPVADAPVLAVTDASGAEDTPIALDVTATSPDTVSVTFAGVPEGAVLSAGTDNGDGTWTVDAGDLAGLTLTPPADYSGTLNLFAVATATDGSESATTSEAFSVTVTPVADAPTLTAADITGAEDTAIALDIDTAVTDGSEVLSVTIGNIPDGAVLNA
ncbi:Ig-like domain-containing protein, partial [Thalassospira mesophila]